MREALHVFAAAYRDYLQNPTQEGRSAVLRTLPEADVAAQVSGAGMGFTDPPAMGAARRTYTGLSGTAFLHEQFGWEEVNGRPTPVLVLEGVERADAALAAEERRVAKRQRNPLYWIDRAIRLALMLPAYLVSVILGESVWKIDRSALGLPFRVLAVVANVLGVYLAGQALGWW
jgi:hypothetical protein